MQATPQDRHLDLGCGSTPRNPYAKKELHGIDINPPAGIEGVNIVKADLLVGCLPFDPSFFGSVSAFDLIEHIPRVALLPDENGAIVTTFPFVRLMNEIWRVLCPGGVFYALTPGYPNAAAFVDPTHVNFITIDTHKYFVGDNPMARMYGFEGRFRARRAEWVIASQSFTSHELSMHQKIRRFRHGITKRLTHILWELEAVK